MKRLGVVFGLVVFSTSVFSQGDLSQYSFSMQESKPGAIESSVNGDGSSDVIEVKHRDLPMILSWFYGVNGPRILSNDSALLKTRYDLTLKTNKSGVSETDRMKALKDLISGRLGVQINEISKDTLVYVLLIDNDELLKGHITASGFGTSSGNGWWSAKGATLEKLKVYLEEQYNVLVEVGSTDDRKFELTLPSDDFENAKTKLQKEYGIVMLEKKQKAIFWEVNR